MSIFQTKSVMEVYCSELLALRRVSEWVGVKFPEKSIM